MHTIYILGSTFPKCWWDTGFLSPSVGRNLRGAFFKRQHIQSDHPAERAASSNAIKTSPRESVTQRSGASGRYKRDPCEREKSLACGGQRTVYRTTASYRLRASQRSLHHTPITSSAREPECDPWKHNQVHSADRQKEPEDVGDEGVNNSVLDGGGWDCRLERKNELVSFSVVLYDKSHRRGPSLEVNKWQCVSRGKTEPGSASLGLLAM